VSNAPRLLRGTLPCLAALAIATGFALPANARSAGATRSAEWWMKALNVSQAWRAAPGEGKGVTVAVLSTGVDATHRDLAGDVTVGRDYCDSGRTAAGPFWGYEGTAVASLLAGHGHRQGAGHGGAGPDGITGIAPAARILAVQVTLEYNDPLNSDSAITRRLPGAIAAGIRYAVARGASVIALPLDPGTLGPAAPGDPAAGGSRAERAAVSYALARNVVLIAPAGDNGAGTGTISYPAAYPGVVAVGATERDGKLAPFTSTRGYVALTAPGSSLTVADPDGGYSTLASTDMSAALVSGVAALIRAQFPRLAAAGVARALVTGTRPAGAHTAPGSGHGRLDAAGALTVAARFAAVHPAPARTSPPSPSPSAAPPAPHVTPHHVAIRAPGLDTLAGSLLRYAVIAALVLIAALAGALALTAARRQRAQAARRAQAGPRSGQGGSHRRSRSLSAGSTVNRSAAASGPAAPSLRRAAPRIVPVQVTGVLGASGRVRRRKSTGKPPWEPASPPAEVPREDREFPALPSAQNPPLFAPRSLPALPTEGRPAAGQPAALAPWEESPEEFAAAPVPAELPGWSVNSGPMYVWNPNATTAPQPAVARDEDAEPAPG
jgi:hypothetical protein